MLKVIKDKKGFTLIEMLVVLFIISILLVLFVPNISKHRESALEQEKEGIVKVVETQLELYMLEHEDLDVQPSVKTLKDEKYITDKQYKQYQKFTKNE
ncbi:competence type IV pilus major pilin ComGC [Vagococcus silagei]|uniref:Prepilin-type N-terminal cleavage/methylation domain-containing protein n=1 Tax=Vagococcus silagei TaxID=2508885 RepID=A0A4S3B509_9ENTE|nr:competence type IV pilus major pilin ComGC [Vagococcus silagei]THB60516.1 prepilin-type N-terminal cleavage/methylation domain-containing protein [Vagococcus silagei]